MTSAIQMQAPVPGSAAVWAPPSPPLGAWRLQPRQTLGLVPRRAAELRIVVGQVWVTVGGQGQGIPGDSGDRFLSAGECLSVPAGTRLVMEALPPLEGWAPAQFEWRDEAAAGARFWDSAGEALRRVASALPEWAQSWRHATSPASGIGSKAGLDHTAAVAKVC